MIKRITFFLAVSFIFALLSLSFAETTEEKVQRLEAELNALADAIEQEKSSKQEGGGSISSRTKIGGYGELHYNNIDGKKAEIDFHRFVLMVDHEFNERIRFFSELELEHSIAGNGQNGAIELEQAYVEMDINDKHAVKAGVFLMPVGIINETHEPTTFYGVERNPLEKNIIPTTWWEAGVALRGQLGNGGVSYDAALTSGLKVDPTVVNIRNGRQKVSKATAEDLAVTGRLKYTGIPGIEFAGSVTVQDDITQASGDGVDGAVLTAIHAIVNKGRFGGVAQYAHWDIDIDNAAVQNKDKQDGYLLEGSFKATPNIGFFARHVEWSTTDGIDQEQQNVGINFWPHENVVLKADVQFQNAAAGNGDGFNLGIGYQF